MDARKGTAVLLQLYNLTHQIPWKTKSGRRVVIRDCDDTTETILLSDVDEKCQHMLKEATKCDKMMLPTDWVQKLKVNAGLKRNRNNILVKLSEVDDIYSYKILEDDNIHSFVMCEDIMFYTPDTNTPYVLRSMIEGGAPYNVNHLIEYVKFFEFMNLPKYDAIWNIIKHIWPDEGNGG